MASLLIRLILTNSEQIPNTNRSNTDKLGARFRDRLLTNSWCFMSKVSAITALAPPGRASLAAVTKKQAMSIRKCFITEQCSLDP